MKLQQSCPEAPYLLKVPRHLAMLIWTLSPRICIDCRCISALSCFDRAEQETKRGMYRHAAASTYVE